ncbi:MAG TPA: DNA polymerase III subunit delta [Armatimonadota bacterium]|jgi:DNA polymerase-3 subunit delta
MESTPQVQTQLALNLLFGDSRRLRERVAEQIIAAQLPAADREMGLSRLSGSDLSAARLRQETASVSLLSPRRVVLVEEPEGLAAKAQDELVPVLQSLPEGLTVIFLCGPGRARKAPTCAALTKLIAKDGQIVDCSPGRNQEAPTLSAEAREQGKRLSGPAAQKLLELVGGSLDSACQELDKLVLFVGDREEIEPADVELVVSASQEGNMFRLSDSVGRREARPALQALRDLLPPGSRRGSALPLVGMLARQIRLLWQAQAKTAAGRGGTPEALRERFPTEHNYFTAAAGKDWLQRNLAQQSARWPEGELARALLLIYETDRRLKGLGEGPVDDRLAMELLIAELCR